jgi:hypothetical protein
VDVKHLGHGADAHRGMPAKSKAASSGDAFAPVQRVAVVYEDTRASYDLGKAPKNRDAAERHLREALVAWQEHTGRALNVIGVGEYAAAVAAASPGVEISEDPYEYPAALGQYENASPREKAEEDLIHASFEEMVMELAQEGIVQRAYYADLVAVERGLLPDHVVYVSRTHGVFAVLHRTPGWGDENSDDHGSAATHPFKDLVLEVIKEDDTTHGAVYVYDVAVAGEDAGAD